MKLCIISHLVNCHCTCNQTYVQQMYFMRRARWNLAFNIYINLCFINRWRRQRQRHCYCVVFVVEVLVFSFSSAFVHSLLYICGFFVWWNFERVLTFPSLLRRNREMVMVESNERGQKKRKRQERKKRQIHKSQKRFAIHLLNIFDV